MYPCYIMILLINMIYIWIKCMHPEKRIWLPLPQNKQKKSSKKKNKTQQHQYKLQVFSMFFCKYFFFVFCFLFFFLHLLSCAVFFFHLFFSSSPRLFLFSFFLFLSSLFYFLLPFFPDCFLLFFSLLSFFGVFFAFLFLFVLLFVRFFCWNQSCWFLRTSPILVKINCLDLRCVKHIGLTDTPLSQHDFLRCFVTVVLRNFPLWHRDGLRQRQERGCFLSLKVSNLKVSIMFNFHFLLNLIF